MSKTKKLRFAILGAGPTGLDAALAVVEHGHDFTPFEASPQIAGHVQSWRHVQLFTPWSLNVSMRMHAALREAGREPPADKVACPIGGELIEHVFEPISEFPVFKNRLHLGWKVISVGREGLLKHEAIGSAARGKRKFRLLVEDSSGQERLESADVVLDCTGKSRPSALGGGGIPAPGERKLENRLDRRIPDLSIDRESFLGRTLLLIGAGHSAQTALRDLVALADEEPATRVVRVIRRDPPVPTPNDRLPQRYSLMARAHEIASNPPDAVEIRPHSTVDDLAETEDGRLKVTLRSGGQVKSTIADRIFSLTGCVGDHLLYRQLQIHECCATGGPIKFARALSASSGVGVCLNQTSLGVETLRNPEPGFFILGSKSYGRHNVYLMQVGWQQVDEILSLFDRH